VRLPFAISAGGEDVPGNAEGFFKFLGVIGFASPFGAGKLSALLPLKDSGRSDFQCVGNGFCRASLINNGCNWVIHTLENKLTVD
jgi:hypothetical protein